MHDRRPGSGGKVSPGHPLSPPQATAPPASASHAVVAALAAGARAENLGLRGLRTVAGIRLLALCTQAERDPLLELGQRFGSLAMAGALIDFGQTAVRFWPENLMVLRPCCAILSPDEWTLAQLVEAAAGGDRALFSRILDGLVRRDRHDPLFDRSALLAGMLS